MSEVARDALVRRSCELAIWALPAVAIYDLELAILRDAGAEPGTIAYMTAPMDSRHGMLTANDVTPYVFAGMPLNGEPHVIEVPPIGEKAQLFGSVLNAWQRPLVDVGPSGEDAGEGGRYLIVPPGYQGEIPSEDYIVVQSDTAAVHFSFRPVAINGGQMADQSTYSQSVSVYPLSDPDATWPYIDVYENPVNTLPVYDYTFFTDLNTAMQREMPLERDYAMTGRLASIGIVPGEPFDPDEETKAAMLEGLQCAYDYMQHGFESEGGGLKRLWDDRQHGTFNFPLEQAKKGLPFINDTGLMIDKRAYMYFYVTYLPKTLGGGTYYISGLRDSGGELLNGEDTYRLNVPADTPAEDFWSVIVYSMETKGFIQGKERVGLASPNMENMIQNDDGSIDVYFAPEAPEGMEANWIPTGEDWFILFRLYGPSEGWYESGWQLPDFEKLQ
ncbi:DUF1214 domain-containing protein [Tropicimonas sp. TH_r6]|uniref:DUF1214 domain-containing protein n=1 Tax=Tropicimonas sp. TH_r6 TaxID=3082085 RepID=UPI002954566F|nr:DUF1214 domain-containing protein [Tropicimonas sp. TH_r6]MDV7145814.1 DUF1214 domain-containing protein [Tropicimonas sp. TH_r6]